jgi:hypothetical protein
MTSISFTSGELLDIIDALSNKEKDADESNNPHLAAYYFNLVSQFETICDKLSDFQPENRVANLVLTVN